MNSPGFPVCKPGAYYAIHPERELTYDKISSPTQTFTFLPLCYAISDNPTPDKSFRGNKALCHTAAKCYQL